ncbi:hypothetical protein LT697_00715 [Pseudomonas syringae pv. syringae]|uniref:hypothetical protein n=1 Tax=Pseudomonas syringae TaxID=317 RepID=UPI00200B8138|nr:hypothetical protein [Pseudomonas syringae]MCK9740066.1 hypothetical protein [Pseudomonas syringae pv. syringae]
MSNEFKMVPIEPTDEMLQVGCDSYFDSESSAWSAMAGAYTAMLAAAPQPPAEPVVWGSPKTVGQLIRQLQTLDPALETVALYRLPDDIPGVGGKVKQGHISTSYERMEGIWLGPYKGDGRKVIAFWTKLDPRPVPDGAFLTQTPPLGDIYESHAIVAAAYKQLLSALGNEEMSHSDALAAISARPATAKVVLPERMPGITHTDSHEEGWNACIDEVAKLNANHP